MYTQLKLEIANLDTEFAGLHNNFANMRTENVNLGTELVNLTMSYGYFRNELENITTENNKHHRDLQNISVGLSTIQKAAMNLTSAYQQQAKQFSGLEYQYTKLNEKFENQSTDNSNANSGTSQGNKGNLTNNNITNVTKRVGFSVSMPEKATIGRDGPLKFTHAIYNDNEAFNFTSAMFVCKVPGLYFFSSTIIRETGGYPESFCYLMIKGFAKAYLGAYSFKGSDGNPSGTASVLYHMQEGDTAYVGMCGVIRQIAKYSNFNGFLIQAD
ncbi:uncharacterized protein LOC123528749 [Mercenaria mercenaria]|uniref:uncharacterized protein LOC123528749 n=1 Tax=Mercenaria mercenaria TaxID=6596 RepID=UPI00234EBC96|nr:uncharacterized protein LOC123528749 [Mercenaria mercenaria]